MGYIYKISNDINDKVYIGKTCLTITTRWNEHIHELYRARNNQRPLYNAMEKYGVEHFYIEELEQCKDELISEREQYYIKLYDSYSYGYNATKGGDGKLLYDHEAIINELKQNPYTRKVAGKFNCSIDLVQNLAKANNIQTKTKADIGREKCSKKVGQFNKDTDELMQIFDSCLAAARYLGNENKAPNIGRCANQKRITAYGFKWKWL